MSRGFRTAARLIGLVLDGDLRQGVGHRQGSVDLHHKAGRLLPELLHHVDCIPPEICFLKLKVK